MNTTPPVIEKRGRRVGKGCLSVIVLFMTIGVGGYFYLRSPHFSGSMATSMELTMWPPDGPSPDATPLVQANLTNAQDCASLLGLLRSARYRMDHKCGDIGTLKIRYTTEKSDTLRLLPGHDPARYEFRLGSWLYRLPRDRFYAVLRDAGVDTTKMPESEH